MRRERKVAGMVAVAGMLLVAGLEAGQRGWVVPLKPSVSAASSAPRVALPAGPRASIGGVANGLYCSSAVENGVSVHDLGALPAGLQVTVTVESYSDGFDPAAAVLVATLGQKGGDTIDVKTFYDNDSGGDGDARISFVTPAVGVYLLLVNDYTDSRAGCYRYQMMIAE